MKFRWDGKLSERRYAMFGDVVYGDHIIMVTGNDMITAPKWGNFIKWIGKVRPAETRNVKNR